MLLSINHHNGVPVYRQLIDQIRLQVSSGVLPAGAELPSTRALSAQLALNPMTISKAYGLLERDGILERRRGQTLTVRALPRDEAVSEKTAQFRASLATSVTMARQLDITPAQALRIFRELLDQTDD